MTSQILTQETLKELLDYNSETGVFTWLQRDRRWFKTERAFNTWNTRFSGETAGRITAHHYCEISLLGFPYRAHRLAFLYMTGDSPPYETDHINGHRADNRWENLRQATKTENMRNQAIGKNNTSGRIGVSWNTECKKWVSNIRIDGARVHLGYFHEFEDAVAARMAGELRHGFHPNHGRVMQ